MGIITPPNNSLVMGRTSKTDLGLISSILALSRNLGMMFGTAAGGAMLALPAQGQGLTGFRMIFVLNTALVVIVYVTMLISFRFGRHKETLSS